MRQPPGEIAAPRGDRRWPRRSRGRGTRRPATPGLWVFLTADPMGFAALLAAQVALRARAAIASPIARAGTVARVAPGPAARLGRWRGMTMTLRPGTVALLLIVADAIGAGASSRVAWALCPNCLGQARTLSATQELLGLFLLVPFAIVALAMRLIRRWQANASAEPRGPDRDE